MRIEQLTYLVEIAKTNSISIAAENLYVSQPSVSEAVKKLESELDAKLVNRTKTGSFMTPLGQKIAAQAECVLQELAKIEQIIICDKQAKLESFVGNMIIYTSPSVGNLILPKTLVEFRKVNQDVVFTVFNCNTKQTLTAVAQKSCDLGIVTVMDLEETLQNKQLKTELLTNERVYLEVSRQSPLAEKSSISLKEAARLPLALLAYTEDDTILEDALFGKEIFP